MPLSKKLFQTGRNDRSQKKRQLGVVSEYVCRVDIAKLSVSLAEDQEDHGEGKEEAAGLQASDQESPGWPFCGKHAVKRLVNLLFHGSTPREQDIPRCRLFQGTIFGIEL